MSVENIDCRRTCYGGLGRQKGQPYMMASSATSLSNMLLLAGQYHDALRYVDTAEAYIVGDGDMRRKCELGLIRAQAFRRREDYGRQVTFIPVCKELSMRQVRI